jgi:hypothetical protein
MTEMGAVVELAALEGLSPPLDEATSASDHYYIRRVTGDFADPAAEQAYIHQTFPSRLRVSIVACGVGSAVFAAMAILDLVVYSGTSILTWLLLSRLMVALSIPVTTFLLRRSTPKSLERYLIGYCIFLFVSVIWTVILYGRPEPWGLFNYAMIAASIAIALPMSIQANISFNAIAIVIYAAKT